MVLVIGSMIFLWLGLSVRCVGWLVCLLVCNDFLKSPYSFYDNVIVKNRVSDPDPQDPHVFALPGSGYGSA